jgi:hypothetical protein
MLKTHEKIITAHDFDALVAPLEAGEQAELTKAIEQGQAQFAAGQFKTLAEATAILEAQTSAPSTTNCG